MNSPGCESGTRITRVGSSSGASSGGFETGVVVGATELNSGPAGEAEGWGVAACMIRVNSPGCESGTRITRVGSSSGADGGLETGVVVGAVDLNSGVAGDAEGWGVAACMIRVNSPGCESGMGFICVGESSGPDGALETGVVVGAIELNPGLAGDAEDWGAAACMIRVNSPGCESGMGITRVGGSSPASG